MDSILNLVAGIVLPFVAKACDQYLPNHPTVKYLAILVVCLIAGVLITVQQGLTLSMETALVSLATIATTAQTVYMVFIRGK